MTKHSVATKRKLHKARARRAQEKVNRAMTLNTPSKVEGAILFYSGPRCPDFEPECPCCQTWKEYDDLVGRSKGWVG